MFKYKKSRLSAFFAAINIVLADIGGKKTTYIISFRAKSIIIMSISVVMLVACERHASTSEQMDIAEKLMNTKPDSALTILNSIHASGFKGKDAARYALLKSMALDKNCIDTTTFDILEPAIDYYIKNSDELLLEKPLAGSTGLDIISVLFGWYAQLWYRSRFAFPEYSSRRL